MDTPTKIYLAVPYEEKGQAKAIGARWDIRQRAWYATDPSRVADFARWLPELALDPGETIRLPVLLLPTTCFRCHRAITCVIGLRLPDESEPDFESDFRPSGTIGGIPYLAVEACGEVLGVLLDLAAADLADPTLNMGPLLLRQTEPHPEGYVANTCVHCGSTQGAFPLFEDLVAFETEDRDNLWRLWSYGLEVDFPVAAIPRWSAEADE